MKLRTWGWLAVVALVALSVAWFDINLVDAGVTGFALASSGGFGAPFRPLTKGQTEAMATPPSGGSAEDIWHQLFDTQPFVSATTVQLTFFRAAQNDRTLSNMPTGGTLPRPQTLRIHNICLDVLSTIPVTTSATLTGVLDDLALIIFGLAQRPTWTLSISDKSYGPYSLTTLHGTGGPHGFGWSGDGAEIIQYARNAVEPGWNYYGRIIIPEQVDFNIVLNWAAAATITADKLIRVSMFGVLGRRVS